MHPTLADAELKDIDLHVGTRIRLRRGILGVTQEQLGDLLGVTYQQIQNYETGRSRISASRLFEVAYLLGATVSFFFEDREADDTAFPSACDGTPRAPEARDLVRAFIRIADPEVRQRVIDLVREGADSKQLRA